MSWGLEDGCCDETIMTFESTGHGKAGYEPATIHGTGKTLVNGSSFWGSCAISVREYVSYPAKRSISEGIQD